MGVLSNQASPVFQGWSAKIPRSSLTPDWRAMVTLDFWNGTYFEVIQPYNGLHRLAGPFGTNIGSFSNMTQFVPINQIGPGAELEQRASCAIVLVMNAQSEIPGATLMTMAVAGKMCRFVVYKPALTKRIGDEGHLALQLDILLEAEVPAQDDNDDGKVVTLRGGKIAAPTEPKP